MEMEIDAGAVVRLVACPSIASLAETFGLAIAKLGMTASASGMVSGPRAVTQSRFHFTNWPQEWIAAYGRLRLVERDPIPRWAILSGEAVSWDEVIARLPPNDPGREVGDTAADHGFHSGFVTPVRTREGHLGLVSVGGGRRGPFRHAERTFLQTLSIAVLNRAEALLGPPEEVRPFPAFSLRERECHALLQQGFTDNEIARVLAISGETVRFHLNNARRKAGARNRVHLAAMQLGIGGAARD